MNNTLYPLVFNPVYKDYLWGGSRIPETFNRDVPEGIYAESWEISDHDDGMSVCANGPFAGKTLRELLETYTAEILGPKAESPRFPLLIKLIDAKQKLSVQVHPNDENAAQVNGEAKTEMWYLIGEEDAKLYCGFNEGVTKESFLQAVEEGSSADTLKTLSVKKGDAVFVPGGRVHAIADGCLILEIQQNSNTTYRLYDWDRVDANGQGRELHIEKAVEVITWNENEEPLVTPKTIIDKEQLQLTEILNCPFFMLEKLTYSAPVEVIMSGEGFHALFVGEGEAKISWEGGTATYPAGTSILIPAALPAYTLGGTATVLRTSIPQA